ncbi:MAG: hypothetical protein PHW04_13395 [Candidatus Wallbacteria bacterium]|nr:hypothetical protein [Candidatus Wallbacteria bacterium]
MIRLLAILILCCLWPLAAGSRESVNVAGSCRNVTSTSESALEPPTSEIMLTAVDRVVQDKPLLICLMLLLIAGIGTSLYRISGINEKGREKQDCGVRK